MKNKYRVLAALLVVMIIGAFVGYETGRVSDPGEYVYPLCHGGYVPVAVNTSSDSTPCIAGPAYSLQDNRTVLYSFVAAGVATILVTLNETGRDFRKRHGRQGRDTFGRYR